MYCHHLGVNVMLYSIMVKIKTLLDCLKHSAMSKADVNSKSRPLNLHRLMFYFKNHYGPTKENWI